MNFGSFAQEIRNNYEKMNLKGRMFDTFCDTLHCLMSCYDFIDIFIQINQFFKMKFIFVLYRPSVRQSCSNICIEHTWWINSLNWVTYTCGNAKGDNHTTIGLCNVYLLYCITWCVRVYHQRRCRFKSVCPYQIWVHLAQLTWENPNYILRKKKKRLKTKKTKKKKCFLFRVHQSIVFSPSCASHWVIVQI